MAPGQPTPDGSIQARNKAVAMRVLDEIFNQGKFHVADKIYASDFQNHGLHRFGGPEGRPGGGAR
jgi:hypothetical protein